jgi:RNA polymerase sigma factor (sigma-70 family)
MARTITAEEFEQLYLTTAPELFAYFRRRGTTDVEDLVAEVFATAWRRRTDLPAPMLRRAWLYGTARNLLLAESRRHGREQDAVEQLAARPADVPAEPTSRTGEVVSAALARLSPSDREVIVLVEWERLTPAELAVALGVRPGTARVKLHRARQALAADPSFRELCQRASVTSNPASS